MAAPHVTGLIALLMQAANRKLTIAEIRDAVMSTAQQSACWGSVGSKIWKRKGRCYRSGTHAVRAACPSGISHNNQTVVNGARLATVRTNHGRSDFGHGRNRPEVRGKVRLQVEVEPLDVQRR